MTYARAKRDTRYTVQKYEDTLSDLVLCEKVNLCDIPFEVRKREIYVISANIAFYINAEFSLSLYLISSGGTPLKVATISGTKTYKGGSC